MFDLWSFLAVSAGGVVAGCAYLLIGGLGVARTLKKRIDALETEQDVLSERITSEVKRRAANAAVEARKEARSIKDLKEEAEIRLLKQPKEASPVQEGFHGMFNRRG